MKFINKILCIIVFVFFPLLVLLDYLIWNNFIDQKNKIKLSEAVSSFAIQFNKMWDK